MTRPTPPWRLLAVWALVELALFVALCVVGDSAFLRLVSTPDSASYLEVARALVRDGTLIPSPRTPGYPLFLAACGRLDGSLRLAIAGQLIINLGLAVGCWHLVMRLVPAASPRLRALTASICFVAGLGPALQLLTDLVAAACLFVALYGLLFWRRRAAVIAAAVALGLATLMRPTFTLLPLLLPLVVWWAGRVHARVPRGQLALFIACSLGATALSVGYQYRSDGYLGPSSVVTFNVEATMHHALAPDELFDAWQQRFEERLARRAGTPSARLSRTQTEQLARRELVDALVAHPLALGGDVARTTVKYLLAPIEGVFELALRAVGSEAAYVRFVRPVLFLACLPLWLLAYLPPPRRDARAWAYWALTMTMLLYVAGLSAMAPAQGERMRLPVVALLLPLVTARLARPAAESVVRAQATG